MGRNSNWPPRIVQKPGTTEARTYFNGRWWTCGLWDVSARRASDAAAARHMEYVNIWLSDAGADPRGLSLVVDVLRDWLKSPDAPVDPRDRSWVPKIMSRLIEFRRGMTAESFGASTLAEWQDWLCRLENENGETIYNRTSVRRHMVQKLIRAMTWAAREKKYSVSFEQVLGMKEVPPPKATRVREPNVVLPCSSADLDTLVAASHPQLAAFLRLVWWTGARPNELLSLRGGDILIKGTLSIPKTTPIELGEVWAAQVKSKISRLGHVRCLLFGPRAQEVLRPLLESRKAGEYLFSPMRAVDKPGERTGRNLGAKYTPHAISHAVRVARKRAWAKVIDGDHFHSRMAEAAS